MERNELKEFLEAKVLQYNTPSFIETDPISIPHQFRIKEDIEVSGFLAATIAWGNRKMILQNARKLMNLLGGAPYDFVMSHREHDLEKLDGFVHRTFNTEDLRCFVIGLKHVYQHHGGLEQIFASHQQTDNLHSSITALKQLFFQVEHHQRSQKHISDPSTGSAAKRLHMMLRWFVRSDKAGVDLGIWKNIPPSSLSCPLDVHSGNVARKLGLLLRTQNDLKAVMELDENLRSMDAADPAKYDFALFGLGVFEKF